MMRLVGYKSEVIFGLDQRVHVICYGLFVFFVQFNLQPLPSHFEPIHLLNGLLGGFGVVEAHEADSFGFSVFLSHDSGGVNVSEPSEEVVEF